MCDQNQKKTDKLIKAQRDQLQNAAPEAYNPHDLAELIIESICPGIVAFDQKFRIIRANSRAVQLVDVGEYIDRSLAAGTDAKVWGNWNKLLESVLKSGRKTDFKAVRYNFNGRKRLLNIGCTPLKQTSAQQVKGAVMVIEDITEKADIEAQLARAERFAAVGKVAGKVAHELNNPMDGILRYINLALRVIEKQDLEKATRYLHQCRAGLTRMLQIISELLEFSRGTYPAFEHGPVNQMVEAAVKTMESHAKGIDIEVIEDFQGDMPSFKGSNLLQVFNNLIKNAIDAMEGTGRLTITISGDSDKLDVEFRDTGPGFAHENAEVIFEPFFTTKRLGRGAGLGLAICKDIVEKYNGRITARNAPEGGGIFTVCLPLMQEKTPKL